MTLCPFCRSDDLELVSAFGAQIITSQLRCRSCNSYFEAVRQEFDGRELTTERHAAQPFPSGRLPSERHG